MAPSLGGGGGGDGGRPSQALFVLYSVLTVLFGLMNGTIGPVLLELEGQAGVDDAGIGAVLMYRGIGSMFGGFAVGFILDAVRDPHAILVVLLAAKALVELSMPFGRGLTCLSLQLAAIAANASAVATLCSTSVFWTYGKLMGPKVNIMEFAFGVGASAAPMLATLLRVVGSRGVFAYWALAAGDALCIVAALAIPATQNPRLAASETSRSEAKSLPSLCNKAEDSGYSRLMEAAEEKKPEAAAEEEEEEKEGTLEVDWLAVALCGASLLTAALCEAVLAFWLFAYSTEQLGLTEGAAGTVNTAFFVTFTATRFLCGWLVSRVSATSILRVSLTLAIVASLCVVYPNTGAALQCFGMLGIGVGVAPFAANTVTVLGERSFISSRAQGSLRVVASLGVMMGSSGTGFLRKWPPVGKAAAMPAVVLVGLVAETLVTVAMLAR